MVKFGHKVHWKKAARIELFDTKTSAFPTEAFMPIVFLGARGYVFRARASERKTNRKSVLKLVS